MEHSVTSRALSKARNAARGVGRERFSRNTRCFVGGGTKRNVAGKEGNRLPRLLYIVDGSLLKKFMLTRSICTLVVRKRLRDNI